MTDIQVVLSADEYEKLVIDEARGWLEEGADISALTRNLKHWRRQLLACIAASDATLRNVEVDRSAVWPSAWAAQREKLHDLKMRRARALHHRRKLEQRLRDVNARIAVANAQQAAARDENERAAFRDLAAWLSARADVVRLEVPDRLLEAFDVVVNLREREAA